MSISKFYQQTWTLLLAETSGQKVSEKGYLLPTLIIHKLTVKEIEEAERGIYPRPPAKKDFSATSKRCDISNGASYTDSDDEYSNDSHSDEELAESIENPHTPPCTQHSTSSPTPPLSPKVDDCHFR